MGKTILPHMHKLLRSGNALLRIEVAKVVELISDKSSITILISLLGDPEFEVRWIAAEALIKIGRPSVLPLLKLVRDGRGNYYIDRGVHHVLINLLFENEKKKLSRFLTSLDNFNEMGEIAQVEASRAVTYLEKAKTI